MGLFDALRGLIGGGTATAQAPGRNAFPKILSLGDWWQTALETASGKIAVKSGGWVRIGQYKVPPQQMFHYGYGRGDLPYNQGYLYMVFKDDSGTPVAIPGKVRFSQMNANETMKLVVFEARTEQLSGDPADRNKMLAFPEQVLFPFVGEDSLLVIEFLADSASAVNLTKASCTAWNVPVTVLQ